MRILKTKLKPAVNGIVNYLAAVGLAVVFALYMSGRVGWFFVIAFVGAPFISVLMARAFVRRIYISCDYDSLTMCKGDSCEITVNVTNSLFLPTPPILADMYDSPSVRAANKLYTVSVLPFDTESFSVKYTAGICGPSEIGIESVRVTDYFGLVSFDIVCEERLNYSVSVIPDIAEVPITDPVVSKAAELTAFSDDSEDTVDSADMTFGGFPGYDSREYVPGDSLKRINWKQSAKRGRLLVRLDDEVSCFSVAIVLDSFFDKEKVFVPAVAAENKFIFSDDRELICLMAQDAVERALGIAEAFVMQKYSVSFYLSGANGWECFGLTDENDLTMLRTELSSYSFSNSENRFPEEELKGGKSSTVIFCTPYLDDELSELLYSETGRNKGALQTVIYPSSVSPRVDREMGEMAV